MTPPTPPGYLIDSEDIAVMFVSGHQDVLGWHNAEYVIGWKTVMRIILGVFQEKKRMAEIQEILHNLLEIWAEDGWMGRGKKIIVDLKITEEDFLPFDIKQVKIQFYDDLATLLRFYVKKRKSKRKVTLKEHMLRELSFLVEKSEDVDSLELPRSLEAELKDEIENCWKSRHILEAQTRRGRARKATNADRLHRWMAEHFDDDVCLSSCYIQ